MRELHCDICNMLVAKLASGSKIQIGCTVLCRKCSGTDNVANNSKPESSCKVVDDMMKMFGMKR